MGRGLLIGCGGKLDNIDWKYYDWRKPYYTGVYDDGSNKYDWYSLFEDPLYIDRNYIVFSVLANVRNRYKILPISKPKELPHDVTSRTLKESNDYGIDGHSHSWLTVQELLSYKWSSIYYEYTEHFRKINIPALVSLGNPDDVRIVFWFDN